MEVDDTASPSSAHPVVTPPRSSLTGASTRADPFLVDILQYRFIETQNGHLLTQAGALVLQLLELQDLVRLQTRVLLLPTVKRLRGNTYL